MKFVYVMLGFFFLALGAVGAVLPLLPTTPFLLLAAFFFAKGSERFDRWFKSTGLYKRHLASFLKSRAMTRKAKISIQAFASTMMVIAFITVDFWPARVMISLIMVYMYYYFFKKIKTIAAVETGRPAKSSKMFNGRLLGLVEHSKTYIALGVAVNWIALLSNMAAVISITILLQRAWEGEVEDRLLLITAAIVAGAITVRLCCGYTGAMLSFRASANAKRTLRSRIYGKLLKLGATYKEKVSTAETVQVAVEGVEQLEHYFGRYMPQLFYSLLAPVTLFAVLSFINLKAALILLLCVPLIPVSIVAIMRFAKKLFSKYWGVYVNLGDSFLENLQGLTTFKIYQADQRRHDEMNESAESFRRITMKVLTMQLNSVAIMDLIAFGGAGLGAGIAAWELASGRIELWGALSIVLLSAEFFIPLRLLGSFFHIAMNGMAASDKIFRLLDMEEGPVKTAEVREGDLVLDRLGFGYDPGRSILQRITMHIPKGSLVSIVGESGAGKSTLAALLSGRIKKYDGTLSLGGVEIAEASEDSLVRHVTWIGHSSYIFRGTVEDNLRMGNPLADEMHMREALDRVRLLEFLLPQGGLAFQLEDQGANLSGGQRQRLALARALLHDSPVYIFDEATSNIDVESEARILDVIHSMVGRKTVILISHRLVNVMRSDRIYVLSAGKLTEQGNHEELLKRQGEYARLFHTQKDIEDYAKGGNVYA